MYKLLLFDIDDTICNASEAYAKANERCFLFLNKHYPLLTREVYNRYYSLAREEIHKDLKDTAPMHERFLYFQRMFELLGLPLKPDLIYRVSKLYWKTTVENLKLYPHVKKTLILLKENNFKIGIISDLTIHVQISKLRHLGIENVVDFIVTSEEAKHEKPNPEPFLLALKKAQCNPEEAIMVGDALKKDVEGAKKIGITAVLIKREKNRKIIHPIKMEKEGYWIVDDFNDLLQIINLKPRKLNPRKKILVFDMMGPIFPQKHIIRNVLHPIVKKNGMKITYDELKRIYEKYSKNEIKREDFYKIVPEEVEREFLDSLQINPEIYTILSKLKKKGYHFGILSNIPRPWGHYLEEKFNLKKHFNPIVFSGDYRYRKPSEELYRIFIENTDCLPSKCYFLDDKLVNLKEARFFAMKTIHYKMEQEDFVFLPDHQITDLSELVKILK